MGEARGEARGSLGTLPFAVVARLLERAPLRADAGRALRRALLQRGAVRLLLACLAVFTHHRPNSNDVTVCSTILFINTLLCPTFDDKFLSRINQ